MTDQQRLFEAFNGNVPATSDLVKSAELALNLQLPKDYVQFLNYANGGEGFIGPNAYVMLWRVEELAQMNLAYEAARYVPGLLIFGSDGGGEAFAFDTRAEGMPVVSVPFVGMAPNVISTVAPNFSSFLEQLFQA